MLTKSKKIPAAILLVLSTTTCRVGEGLVPQDLLQPQPVHLATQKSREIVCLAKNIYFESRGEPFHGKVAVAQVTVNRMQHEKHFKSTICGVVYERKQFSWTSKPAHIVDHAAWQESVKIAQAVIAGTLRLPEFNALYFHATHVYPYWMKTKQAVQTIGNHIFYE